jgi:polyisoprenoid-binding protein YceI
MPKVERVETQIVNKKGTPVDVTDDNKLKVEGTFDITVRTPGVLDITNTAGSTLNTWRSFTVVCVAGTVDIGTETFPVGTYSFTNSNGTLTSIAYDASSSTDCKIIFVA